MDLTFYATNPVAGFDCSGFVGNVYREGLGLILPRSAHELSKTGTVVSEDELAPGDLVFFKTMRHTFSHVGIYLGDHLFIHAPRNGEVVGVVTGPSVTTGPDESRAIKARFCLR